MSDDLIFCTNPSEQSVLNRAGTDKFILVLDLPTVLKRELENDGKKGRDRLQISVHGTIIPEVQLPTIQVPYHGQTYNTTSHTRPNWQPLTVNFVVDNDFYNYWVIWKWISILNTPRTSIYGSEAQPLVDENNLGKHQAHISLYGLNEYNVPVIEFTYYYCFPISLAAINYSYREQGIIDSSFQLQFSQFDVKLLEPKK
jgi:hypothetical protein